ncbi:MAG: hypothetical protein ACK5JQ_04120 [Bacteroidota bacterium]|jgi:hypothetical protein
MFNSHYKNSVINHPLMLMCLLLFSMSSASWALSDSIVKKQVKVPRHYIRPSIYFSGYGINQREITPRKDTLSIAGRYFEFAQRNFGLNAPLYTKAWAENDSSEIKSFQLITTINSTREKIESSILNEARIFRRTSIAFKGIYSDGRKNSFFLAVAPFSSYDQYTNARKGGRLAMVFIYNRTVSEKFSYRLGFMRTFVFGKRLPLPIIGFRFGRLDGVNFNIQLLRNISLNVPIGKRFNYSLFTRPMGSAYSFKNDLNASIPNFGSTLELRRWELLTGMTLSYKASSRFSMFVSAGTSRGAIAFAENTNRIILKRDSYQQYDLRRGGFMNIGLNFYFGRSKQINGNYTMYDVLDLNSTYGNDDNNINLGNSQIPAQNKAMQVKNLQFNDVKDLISETDIY